MNAVQRIWQGGRNAWGSNGATAHILRHFQEDTPLLYPTQTRTMEPLVQYSGTGERPTWSQILTIVQERLGLQNYWVAAGLFCFLAVS